MLIMIWEKTVNKCTIEKNTTQPFIIILSHTHTHMFMGEFHAICHTLNVISFVYIYFLFSQTNNPNAVIISLSKEYYIDEQKKSHAHK